MAAATPRSESPTTIDGHPDTVRGTARPINHRIANEDYYQAVVAAGLAPSAHDSQPWRWRVADGILDLFAAHQRMSRFPDPDGRLATISCGAALHHARLTLAARGWSVTVTRRPVTGDSTHVARLIIGGKAPVDPDAADLARFIDLPRTDQRPLRGEPVEPAPLRAVSAAFEAQDVRVSVLNPAQILELTAATGRDAATGSGRRAEPASWSGTESTADPLGPQLPGKLGVDEETPTIAVLHGPHDHDIDWLRAGEALSAASLAAARAGLSLRPISAPVEHAAIWTVLRTMPELGHPYLIVRLGRQVNETDVPHLSRPQSIQTIDLLSLVAEPD